MFESLLKNSMAIPTHWSDILRSRVTLYLMKSSVKTSGERRDFVQMDIRQPASVTYSTVVARDSVRILLLIAALNELDVLGADVQNAFLTATGSSQQASVFAPTWQRSCLTWVFSHQWRTPMCGYELQRKGTVNSTMSTS